MVLFAHNAKIYFYCNLNGIRHIADFLWRTASLKPLGASASCFPLEKTAAQISAALLDLRQTDMLLVFSVSAAITLCKVLSAFLADKAPRRESGL